MGEEGGDGGVEDVAKTGAALEERDEGRAEDVAFLLGQAGCFGKLQEVENTFWGGGLVQDTWVLEELEEDWEVKTEETFHALGVFRGLNFVGPPGFMEEGLYLEVDIVEQRKIGVLESLSVNRAG